MDPALSGVVQFGVGAVRSNDHSDEPQLAARAVPAPGATMMRNPLTNAFSRSRPTYPPPPPPPPPPSRKMLVLAPVTAIVVVRVGVLLVKDLSWLFGAVRSRLGAGRRGRDAEEKDKETGRVEEGGGGSGTVGCDEVRDVDKTAVSTAGNPIVKGIDETAVVDTANNENAPTVAVVVPRPLPKAVSDSSKSIAALRAVETESGDDALFRDPFAAALAGEEAMAGEGTGEAFERLVG